MTTSQSLSLLPVVIMEHVQVTGMDIAADEVVLNLADHGKLSYDGKRDAWQGFQPDDYALVVERYVPNPFPILSRGLIGAETRRKGCWKAWAFQLYYVDGCLPGR